MLAVCGGEGGAREGRQSRVGGRQAAFLQWRRRWLLRLLAAACTGTSRNVHGANVDVVAVSASAMDK